MICSYYLIACTFCTLILDVFLCSCAAAVTGLMAVVLAH